MIEIQARLQCDTCRCQYLVIAEAEERIGVPPLDQLRRRAAKDGWKRFRPAVTAPMRDYCAACVPAGKAVPSRRRKRAGP